MIKAAGQDAFGQPVVLIGLSGENVTRLMADEPIRFNLGELGLRPCTVVIVGGRTEEEITRTLENHGLLPPGTAGRADGR